MKNTYTILFPLLCLIIFFTPACDQKDIWSQATREAEPVFIEVVHTTPFNGEEYVSINSHIFITFNDNIERDSINSSTIYFTSTSEILFYNYYPLEKTIQIIPKIPLSSDTGYELTITTGLRNLVGETLNNDYTMSFKTASALEPEIVLFTNDAPLLSGETYDFGTIAAGEARNQTYIIYNIGSADLIIQSLQASGPDATSFTLDTIYLSTTIPAGGFSSFMVSFSSGEDGIKNGEIIIANNDNSESILSFFVCGVVVPTPEAEILVMQGQSIIPEIDGVFDFGTIAVGESSIPIPITVHNIGNTDLIIDSITKESKSADLFSINTDLLLRTIPPLDKSSFYIQFSPTNKGSVSTSITILNNDQNEGTFIFKVKGRGY